MDPSIDYSFRKSDLSLFPGLRYPSVPVDMGVLPGRLITGKSKEAQRFMVCLMTPLGHLPSDPLYGSNFPEQLIVGGNSSIEEMRSVFSAESLRVLTWMDQRLPANRLADEDIESVELGSWSTASRGKLYLEIHLFFRDGVEFPMPVTIPLGLTRTD